MIWPLQLFSLRQGTSVQLPYLQINDATSWNQNTLTVYQPQTDGETERVNQELKIYFWIFCTNNPKMWKSLNLLMEFSHNQKVHSVMKQSLFYLIMGYEPKDIPLAFENTNTSAAEHRLKTLNEARNKASTAHELARQWMAE